MFYFRSRHGLTCRWPPPQACPGSRFWCTGSPSAPLTSQRLPPASRSVAPFSAARVAAALRMPWADFPTTPAASAAATNSVPSAPLVQGAAPGNDEGQIPGGPGVKRCLQLRQQWQLDPHTGLFAVNRDYRPADRLPADTIVGCFRCWRPRIATSPIRNPGVGEDVEDHPLAGAARPAPRTSPCLRRSRAGSRPCASTWS